MSGPFPDQPPPVARDLFASGRSRSSSQLRTESSRRPSISTNPASDADAPSNSRQHSFSATSPIGSAGLVFPGPAHAARPPYSSRSSGAGDDEQQQESLASPYQPYFPGPPTSSSSRRDYLDRAPDAAQYPLPQSRQQSVDSSIGTSDLPTFTMPFPPPPPSSSSAPFPRSPSVLSPVDPISGAAASRSRSHLGPGTLHKNQSSSSLSGTSSAYSYEAASPSPGLPPGVGPSPDPISSSVLDASLAGAGSAVEYPARSPSAVGDFARRGEGLGLGRAIMDSPPVAPETRSESYGGAGGGSYEAEQTMQPRAQEDLVPTGFDEGVLRALCDSDVRPPLSLSSR